MYNQWRLRNHTNKQWDKRYHKSSFKSLEWDKRCHKSSFKSLENRKVS